MVGALFDASGGSGSLFAHARLVVAQLLSQIEAGAQEQCRD